VGGVIVETEAYEPDDPASHSFGGKTRRNATMFGAPGHLYIYRSYGVHWCANVVCREEGVGAAVLLRALEPTVAIDVMRTRRRIDDIRLLAAGPGRLTQALGISDAHDGLDVSSPPFALGPPDPGVRVVESPRVGITRAADRLWRYSLAGSTFVSRPRPRA
jgi:DNA-3-methyladenine glycosylase